MTPLRGCTWPHTTRPPRPNLFVSLASRWREVHTRSRMLKSRSTHRRPTRLAMGSCLRGLQLDRSERGGWYDFAQTYRSFAVRTPWYGRKTLAQRTDVPVWMKDAGLINIGASPTDSVTLDGQLKAGGAPADCLCTIAVSGISRTSSTPSSTTPRFLQRRVLSMPTLWRRTRPRSRRRSTWILSRGIRRTMVLLWLR